MWCNIQAIAVIFIDDLSIKGFQQKLIFRLCLIFLVHTPPIAQACSQSCLTFFLWCLYFTSKHNRVISSWKTTRSWLPTLYLAPSPLKFPRKVQWFSLLSSIIILQSINITSHMLELFRRLVTKLVPQKLGSSMFQFRYSDSV